MRVLIIKTSSLGDILHTLPAVSDAGKHIKEFECDWVVEKAFADIPAMHPCVNKVIICQFRLWRKKPWRYKKEWKQFKTDLLASSYDLVIDAQGLLKSAFVTRLLPYPRAGFSYKSCSEGLASLAYTYKYRVAKNQHAIDRIRQLFAKALNYSFNANTVHYAITSKYADITNQKYIIFAHATTWRSKHWPDAYWRILATKANQADLHIKLPWNNTIEYNRAKQIADGLDNIHVLEKQSLTQIATTIKAAKIVVGLDTGLTHFAAALGTPTISLFGATNHALVGCIGNQNKNLQKQDHFTCAPCMKRKCFHKSRTEYASCMLALKPEQVWQALCHSIKEN